MPPLRTTAPLPARGAVPGAHDGAAGRFRRVSRRAHVGQALHGQRAAERFFARYAALLRLRDRAAARRCGAAPIAWTGAPNASALELYRRPGAPEPSGDHDSVFSAAVARQCAAGRGLPPPQRPLMVE
eukprot:gene34669-800_t